MNSGKPRASPASQWRAEQVVAHHLFIWYPQPVCSLLIWTCQNGFHYAYYLNLKDKTLAIVFPFKALISFPVSASVRKSPAVPIANMPVYNNDISDGKNQLHSNLPALIEDTEIKPQSKNNGAADEPLIPHIL